MTITAMKEKLHEYIESANEADVIAMYSFVEDDNTRVYNHWDDKEFVAEMDKRMEELESGKVKGMSWDEVKRQAREITG